MFENIQKRYEQGYIRDDQLQRYVELGVVTQDQADRLKTTKSVALARESAGGGVPLKALGL